ncbi:MAG: hypothetical protein NW226_19925 [Microscillaceae bacterium]|nr:hypothetical protein [Microscillaceae bacterium]
MTTQEQLRQRIIHKIEKLPDDKLNSLELYINTLEQENQAKAEILSFAGIFRDLDQEVINELTIHLHENRLKGITKVE